MWCAVVVLVAATALTPARAQDKPVTDSIPLRVQVVLSRYEGEKRLSNMPYTLWVNAARGPSAAVNLRMGVEVPVPSGSVTKEGTTASYSYRNVGTNIDCSALILEDGRYRLTFGIEQSSIFPENPKQTASGLPASPVMFRSFRTNFVLALRDGQSAQNTTATDPVNGEVLKVDVTMNVIK